MEGWVFKPNEDAEEDDFAVVLYDYVNDEKYYPQIKEIVRDDVNKYFLCEYDYTASGFVATIRSKKIDLENVNYEVLVQDLSDRSAIKTGIYISKGKLMYVKPEDYVPLNVEGTALEEIVYNGVLRVYRPDVGIYVYQYEKNLYWIADESYEFEEDGLTALQYIVGTIQTGKLTQNRLDNGDDRDNRSFNFERQEITANLNSGTYRVTTTLLPTEYAIKKMWTGCYVDKWIWISYFRPWYEFD